MVKDEQQNDSTKEGNSSAADEVKMETGGGGGGQPKFTAAQLARKVICQTQEGEIVEVPWHLMMQSKTFMNMWGNLDAEETFDQKPFIFAMKSIATACFGKIVEWLEQHDGKPEPEVKEEPVTGERVWFTLTDWERNFFDIEFEQLKEFFLAANFLEIRSLYLYCAQECARNIMDKSPEQIRIMLCLPDDLTEEDKEGIRNEFEITNGNGQQQDGADGNNDGQPPAVVNGNADAGQPAANGNDAAVNGDDVAVKVEADDVKVEGDDADD